MLARCEVRERERKGRRQQVGFPAELVLCRSCIDAVVARTTVNDIVSPAARDAIIASLAIDRIVARPSDNDVVAVRRTIARNWRLPKRSPSQ